MIVVPEAEAAGGVALAEVLFRADEVERGLYGFRFYKEGFRS